MSSQIFAASSFSLSKSPVTRSHRRRTGPRIRSFSRFHAASASPLMLSHILKRKSFTAVNLSLISCLMASESSPSISQTLSNRLVTNSHAAENICFTPSQTSFQSPVNSPWKMLITPRMYCVVNSKKSAIVWKTKTKTGARKSQSPCHTAIIVPVTDSHVIPQDDSFSPTAVIKSLNTVLTWSQISKTLLRKSSFVVHK